MSRITEGSRVICHKHGPHNGKRGRVRDVFAGQAKVEFDGTSLLAPVDYFEKV